MGPHDKLLRRLMRERGVAEALLRERLPPALRSRLAGPPELLAESFIGASMRGVMADVVLRAPLVDGTHAVVYCVVEHKRSEHPRALLQVLEYVNALNQHLGRVTPPGPLPPVVPILIHNGATRWRGPTRFSDLVADSAWARPYALDFEVVLVDVAAEPMKRLSAHPTLRGALQGLRASSFSGRRLVRAVAQTLSSFKGDESTQRFFLRYLMNVVGQKDEKALRAASSKSRSSAMQTLANFSRSQGQRPLLRWHDAALDARSLRAAFATH